MVIDGSINDDVDNDEDKRLEKKKEEENNKREQGWLVLVAIVEPRGRCG